MPQLVVQLSRLAAVDLAAGKPKTSAALAVAGAVKTAGATASQMHPGTADLALAGYFSIDLPDGESAANLAAVLSLLPSVEAAYVKPDDAPPGG